MLMGFAADDVFHGTSVQPSVKTRGERVWVSPQCQHVLAIDVPAMSYGKTPQQVVDFYKEAIRRIDTLPGVSKTVFGNVVPWRDGGPGSGLQFSADGHVHASGVEDPRAQWRVISPGFFASLGVPIIAGRDFNALDDRNNEEPVVIVSETLAQRTFPNQASVQVADYSSRWLRGAFQDSSALQQYSYTVRYSSY